MKPLVDLFHEAVAAAICDHGVFPHLMISRTGDMVDIAAIDGAPTRVFAAMHRALAKPATAELVFGLDRETRPGQGTEFADVLVCGHWRRDLGWRIGVINYQIEPRIVRPWDWNNAFWTARAVSELTAFRFVGPGTWPVQPATPQPEAST